MQWAWWPTIRDEMPAYDPDLTPTREMGAIVECFRRAPGVRRSAHPAMSAAAVGPNARALTDDQLATAKAIFDQFRTLDLKPAYLADADPNRALLDKRVICDLLNFNQDTYQAVRLLAAKWCAEPSVHGGKKRPPTAKLII